MRRMMIPEVKVRKLRPEGVIPVRQTVGAAAFDLTVCPEAPLTIQPGLYVKVPTGISMEIPPGWVGKVYIRSGTALKKGIHLANDVGIIDSDYRGEVFVIVHNQNRSSEAIISPGERLAQVIFEPVAPISIVESDELTKTQRADGGFGSTGP